VLVFVEKGELGRSEEDEKGTGALRAGIEESREVAFGKAVSKCDSGLSPLSINEGEVPGRDPGSLSTVSRVL